MARIEATLRLEEAILAPGVQRHAEQFRHQAPLRLAELMPAQARGFRRGQAALLVLASAAAGAGVVAADGPAHSSCLIDDLLLDDVLARSHEGRHRATLSR